MDVNQLSAISFAEGFVEDFLENYVQGVEEARSNAGREPSKQTNDLKAMWAVVSNGLTALRRENTALQNKINAGRIALS